MENKTASLLIPDIHHLRFVRKSSNCLQFLISAVDKSDLKQKKRQNFSSNIKQASFWRSIMKLIVSNALPISK